MKPISELVNDREACERIWQFFSENKFEFVGSRQSDSTKGMCIVLHGVDRDRNPVEFGIYDDFITDVFIAFTSGIDDKADPAFIALMNDLGYGPVRECSDDSPGWAYRDVERT